MKHYSDVDSYLAESELWPDEIAAIRTILLGEGLDEAIKWGKPCYGHDGANICILQEMKNFLAVMFFKGALIEDPTELLHEVGENSNAARRLQFTSVDEIDGLADTIRAYVQEAIDIEEAGLEVEKAPDKPLVAELQDRLDSDADFRAAFEGLTPGRQRAYNLHFSDAKQSETRLRRIEKYAAKILAGKGLQDR